jgi:dihydroxyacetone kinase
VASVGRAADNGAGVILLTGNYAGDVLNFTLAVDALKSEGIDARYLVVTDDIASAPPTEAARRRGIAGDFMVFKAAAAAIEGAAVHEVEQVVHLARADAPLFSVPADRMGVGLGIHGEPGIAEESLPTAAELATLLSGNGSADYSR